MFIRKKGKKQKESEMMKDLIENAGSEEKQELYRLHMQEQQLSITERMDEMKQIVAIMDRDSARNNSEL